MPHPRPRLPKKKELNPFILSDETALIPNGFRPEADIFRDLIQRLTTIRPAGSGSGAPSSITLAVDSTLNGSPDAFVIDVNPFKINVTGKTPDALFLALTTLAKAVGPGSAASVAIPASVISDDPAFPYRGAHFDVCRHFFNVDQVKTFIDMMALHGLNRFHWHLSDDQGWRIEMKSRPRLTSIGSRRDSTTILRNSGRWDHTPVQGYFTHDQAREIVRYAADRHIQIIPEIDLPGHTRAALAAYPELGCTGGPYSVWTEWGVTDDVLCPGKPATMQFITDILNELMDIFPDSPLIHVGGDECPKTAWRDCPDCQALIARLGIEPRGRFSAEDLLQGYVTRHAYDVCAARGRRMIGWDEILQADIPADAVVMSWQAVVDSSDALRRGNDVILSPNSCMYFDFYQTKDTDLEPFAIGGFSPVEKVYDYDPYLLADAAPEASGQVLGVQANLWTEYIPTFSHVQYMELPRMAALAEVQWQQRAQKSWNDFRSRVPNLLAIYDRLGYNYARHITDPAVTYTPRPDAKALEITLSSLPGFETRYTLDGSDPDLSSPLYTSPLLITSSAPIRFASFHDGRRGRILSDTIAVNRASFSPIALNSDPQPGYVFDGAPTLVDGITGTYNYRTGRWLGFNAQPLDATIDLGSSQPLTSVGFNVAVFCCDGVVDAHSAEVLVSDNGTDFTTAATWTNGPLNPDDQFTVKSHTISLSNDSQSPIPDSKPVQARYIRLIVHPTPALPAWHPLAGTPAFLFVDEISAN